MLHTRYAVFYEMKNGRFKSTVQSTNVDSRPEIKLHRARATLLKNKGKVDVNGTLSVFG
jgi:hypothetical protein